MTEQQWLTSTDLVMKLDFLRGRVSDRKLRLFTVALCRQSWPLLLTKPYRYAVDVAERFADGLATAEELALAHADAMRVADWGHEGGRPGPLWIAGWFSDPFSGARDEATNPDSPSVLALAAVTADAHASAQLCIPWATALAVDLAIQHAILSDLVPVPFRPKRAFPQTWRAWDEGNATRMARALYDDNDFSLFRLGILADALLDSGCEDEALVAHLRSPGPHVRGCWAVDAVLEKE